MKQIRELQDIVSDLARRVADLERRTAPLPPDDDLHVGAICPRCGTGFAAKQGTRVAVCPFCKSDVYPP